MVRAKSGAPVEGLCRAGAILAGAPPNITEHYAQFGRNLGMALQVSNDVRAVSAGADGRNDLVVAKRTLPLVFAFGQAPLTTQRLTGNAHSRKLRPRQAQRFGELLRASGGVLYASVVADVFFENACTCLDEAGCAQMSLLKAFLMSMCRE